MIKKTENCLYCGEKMESKTAKKKFCSDLHRVYWNRENKAKGDGRKNEFENAARGRDANGINNDELRGPVINDLTKSTNLVELKKPTGSEKSNFTVNTNPKTLDELKAMCPPELTGFESSNWIGTERQKYNL